MSGQYVIVSSITYAYKGKNALERKGIRATIKRANSSVSDCGCHYVIRIGNAPLDRVMGILKDAHVKVISTGGDDYNLS